MSIQQTRLDADGTRHPLTVLQSETSLPAGWQWGGGTWGGDTYTVTFGTTYAMGGNKRGDGRLGGFHGEIYHDNGRHHVRIYAHTRVTAYASDGSVADTHVSEYPDAADSYPTARQAFAAVPELIREL